MKKQKKPNNLFRIFSVFSEFKWRILIVLIVGIVGIVMASLMPTYLKAALDPLAPDRVFPISNADVRFIFQMLGIFVGLLVINEAFAIVCIFLIINYEVRGTQKLGVMVKRKLDVVPTAVLEKYTAGDLTRIVAYNAPDMMANLLVTLYSISRALFFYITTAIAMFAISPILALVVIASLPLCIFTARFVAGRTQKYFNAQNELSGMLNTYIDQRISLQEFYKTHGLNEDISEFKQKNDAHSKAITSERVATALNTMYINFIRDFMRVLITVICCILCITNGIFWLAALPTFLMFSQKFLDQSVVVTNATNVLQVLNARASRVFEILDYPEVTEQEHIKIAKLPGDIKFEKVTLEENGEKIINNVSFTIARGTSVGIIGPTGGGKHKIVELLAKLAVPTEGKVTFGGVNLSEINSASYYDRISIAFEKPFIVKGTVADNLLYGVGRSLPETVMSTTKKLKSHNFIEQLPQGYETELCDKTSLLSTSQKQAINVARSILENPDLVILDAAMSFADNIIEREVFDEILKMDKEQTKIFVTHRLASIQNCDLIIYMEKGRVAEIGTHKQLMDKKKKYYKAYVGVH